MDPSRSREDAAPPSCRTTTASNDGERSKEDEEEALHLVVVGLGFAGLSALAHVCTQFRGLLSSGKLKVTALEKSRDPDGGLAWGSSCSDCHISNLRTSLMRLCDGWTPSFSEWLAANELGGQQPHPASYLPRRLFGKYLRAQLEAISYNFEGKGVRVLSGATVTAIRKSSPGAIEGLRNSGIRTRFSVEFTCALATKKGRVQHCTEGGPADTHTLSCSSILLCVGAAGVSRNLFQLAGDFPTVLAAQASAAPRQFHDGYFVSPFPAKPIIDHCRLVCNVKSNIHSAGDKDEQFHGLCNEDAEEIHDSGSTLPSSGRTTALARVCVLGTGLTAVDAVKVLRPEIGRSISAPIFMVSRHALLPLVKRKWSDSGVAAVSDHELLESTQALASSAEPVHLDAVVSAFASELDGREGNEEMAVAQPTKDLREKATSAEKSRPGTSYDVSPNRSTISVTTFVRKAMADWKHAQASPIRSQQRCASVNSSSAKMQLQGQCTMHAASQQLAYQNTVVAFEDAVIPNVWQRVPMEERACFLKSRLRRLWQAASNPMPYESAKELLEMMEEGALDIRAELQDISQAQDVCTDLCQPSFVLTFADGSSSSGSSMSHADVVVDATGVDPCLPCVPSEQQTKPFLWQLVQDGCLAPAEPIGAADVNASSCESRVAPGLYVIGHLAADAVLLTSGLGFCRAMVQKALRHALRRITSPHSTAHSRCEHPHEREQ